MMPDNWKYFSPMIPPALDAEMQIICAHGWISGVSGGIIVPGSNLSGDPKMLN
jgi:hypothetical protein